MTSLTMVNSIREGPVGLVRLNRPPVNAISAQVARELNEALQLMRSPDIRAVVITGQPHFAAGADVDELRSALSKGAEVEVSSALSEAICELERLPKPTIAAINGYGLGGGLELAMGADFRYLATDARVGQPEIRLGIVPGAGGTHRLSRIVGFQRAKDLILSGRQLGSDEAMAIGLADRVYPPDEVLERALADAQEWAQGPTRAISSAKRAILDGWMLNSREALDVEAAALREALQTLDAVEGLEAFSEKREPRYEGK